MQAESNVRGRCRWFQLVLALAQRLELQMYHNLVAVYVPSSVSYSTKRNRSSGNDSTLLGKTMLTMLLFTPMSGA